MEIHNKYVNIGIVVSTKNRSIESSDVCIGENVFVCIGGCVNMYV